MTLPGPRLVEIIPMNMDTQDGKYHEDGYTSMTYVPKAFTSVKSHRTETQRSYRLCFGTKNTPARVFFDSSQDTLFLPYTWLNSDFCEHAMGLQYVQSLAWSMAVCFDMLSKETDREYCAF